MKIAIVSRYARKGDGQGRANREITLAALRAGHIVDLYADQVDADIGILDSCSAKNPFE